jgi:hypothetical protein
MALQNRSDKSEEEQEEEQEDKPQDTAPSLEYIEERTTITEPLSSQEFVNDIAPSQEV